jgi:hypothetical protein
MICGYDKDCPPVYEFHHRDPKEKEFSIGDYSVLNKKKLFQEADKCDLLCCRCHLEIHDKERESLRESAFRVNKEWEGKKREEVEIPCKHCNKPIVTKDKRRVCCSRECSAAFKFKVENRPTKEELAVLIANNPMTKIGLMYGVSDNAVRKWARKVGLDC